MLAAALPVKLLMRSADLDSIGVAGLPVGNVEVKILEVKLAAGYETDRLNAVQPLAV